MWLYQMNPTADFFSPEAYRLEVWEGQPWWWRTGNLFPRDAAPPRPGQRIVFYFTGDDTATRGFYGWGIIQRWIAPGAETDDAKGHLEFKITAGAKLLDVRSAPHPAAKRRHPLPAGAGRG
jgi:hypothetical protein